MIGSMAIEVFDWVKIRNNKRRNNDGGYRGGQTAHARNEHSDKDKEDHRHAGFVLVREDAAPIASEFRLCKVASLVNGKRWGQKHAQIRKAASTIKTTAAITPAKCR